VIAFAEGDIAATIGLTVGRDVEVDFQVSEHYPNGITLVIGESVAEISFHPATVETLRDKADAAASAVQAATAARPAADLVDTAGAVS
jgi:hypothetical protein